MGNQPGKLSQSHAHSGRTKKAVHWKSAEPPSQPGRPNLFPVSDQQPDVITLKWDRPLSDGGSQVIGYIVEHRRMGSPHWVRATPQLIHLNEVSISGLEPGWRYQFRVIAENVVGKSVPSELSDPLTVTLQRNAITVPRFLMELKENINVVENERVELRVATLGQPPPEINWFKDGFEIFSSRRTKIVSDNETSVLIFHQVALTDDGEIKCTATNRAGHVITKAKMTVEAPPKIRLPRNYEDGLIVEADEVLRLKVGIAGQPHPEIQWRHEGEIVNMSNKRFEIITTDKNSSFKIDNVKRFDRGEYSIIASNKLGSDVASFLVTVTSKPNPPGKVNLKMSYGKTATLSWTAPIDDGGCKIGNYIVEYFRIGWNVWLKAATTRQLTATLNDLIEGSEYKFRVKAENPYGLSEPSAESDTLFIPDPKRGITKPEGSDVSDENKPIAPKRKTLSPLRSPENKGPTPNRSKVPVQLLDSENLHLEMSYGTPNDVLEPHRLGSSKQVKRSPSPMVPVPKPITKVDEGTSTDKVIRNGSATKLASDSEIDSKPTLEADSKGSVTSLALTRSQEPVEEKKISVEEEEKNVSEGLQDFKEDIISESIEMFKEERIYSSNDEKHDEVHTSSEFLLVFHSKSKAKETDKGESFDLDLEDALSPPQISISSPDLWNPEYPYLQTFPMRRSVSSTELLYERAMARFYEAVELEEAGRSRKSSVVPTSSDPHHRKRLGSMTEAERLSFEKRSQMRRRSSDISQAQPHNMWDSKENLTSNLRKFSKMSSGTANFFESFNKSDIDTSASQTPYGDTDGYNSETSNKDPANAVEDSEAALDYGSDYTASTESLSDDDDSMEKFKKEIRARSVRTHSTSVDLGELDTYHPRDMSAGVFTPYRAPTPDKSAVVLTKPVPLPDPNFVPKPILKKASRENVALRDESAEKFVAPTEKKEKSSKGIKSFFKREKKEKPQKPTKKEAEEAAIAVEKEVKRKTKEAEEKLKKEQQQIMQDEAMVVVDHYSDIVREVGSTRKYHVPLYLDKDELVKAAEKAEQDEQAEPEAPILASPPSPEVVVPKLSLSERKQLQHVQNSASKLAVTKDQQEKLIVSEETRGRAKIIKIKRIIKKRVPSRSRTRNGENGGVVASINATTLEIIEKTPTPPPTPPPEAPVIAEDTKISLVALKTAEELATEAHDTVRSAINYVIDLGLFIIACYVYIFKDARLVIPILALILYRQVGDAIKAMIPNWLKRRKS